MVSFNLYFFLIPAAFLLTLQLVSALPTQTFNSKSYRRTVFDNGNTLARRDGEWSDSLVRRAPVASPCSLLDLDDAQQLPGWSQVEQYARDTWGTGDWTIIINPPGYKDKRATLCVADSVPIVATDKPKCNASRVDIKPNRDHHIKVAQGYTNSGLWNITNATSAAHSLFFSANFKMPNITQQSKDTLHHIIGKGEFINAPHNSFLTVATNSTTKDTEVTQVQDKSCIGTVNQEICIIPAKGRIQFIATGHIWFEYKTKRAPLANPNGGKHLRFTVKIEEVLKNETDRSAWIDFVGYMNTTMRTDYFDECRWKFKL